MKKVIPYTDREGNHGELHLILEGMATLADEDDLARDEHGLTNPYLHRRLDLDKAHEEGEIRTPIYEFYTSGNDSYRYVQKFTYDENDDKLEIP